MSLQNLQDKLGYRFRDERLLQRALTHRSAAGLHNERLEFLGDSVVNMLVAEVLFHRYPQAREGHLTRMRAHLVRGETLAEIARDLGISQCVVLGQGERKSGGADRDSILADTFEALIAAIYLEADLDACRRCVHLCFDARIDEFGTSDDARDAKTRLQEWLQAQGQALPEYRVAEVTGVAHDQRFVVHCHVAAIGESVQGEGGSRKQAEQAAAVQALARLNEHQRGSERS